MGIPFYFKNIITKYPEVVLRLTSGFSSRGAPGIKCGRFFLDFNCILHTSAAKVCQKRPYTDMVSMYNDIINDALDYTLELIKRVEPQDLVYIAVDGTCPRAKMHQQRKRRFMSIWRSNTLAKSIRHAHTKAPPPSAVSTPAVITWDSNTITPGTEFMDILNARLVEFSDTTAKSTGIAVIASGSNEFGEGEHKIYEFMNENLTSCTDIVYGLDADLIMLSLIQSYPIYLLREAPEFGLKGPAAPHQNGNQQPLLLLLDICTLKTRVANEMVLQHASSAHALHDAAQIQSLADDYVMLCTLIGNDFIPPLSCLKIKGNGIELILNAYRSQCFDQGLRLVENHTSLNMHSFERVITALANNENAHMAEASDQYYNTRTYGDPKNMERYLDSYPMHNKFQGLIDTSNAGWRLQWYHHLFGNHKPETVNDACLKFLEGISWVFAYYFTRTANAAWYYPHTYSPTILDLAGFLSNARSTNVTSYALSSHPTHNDFMTTINSDIQLLMVLPPQSRYLMKPQMQSLLIDPRLGAYHYYPLKFQIPTYLKTYLWECTALLPNIDYEHLKRCYSRRANINQNE